MIDDGGFNPGKPGKEGALMMNSPSKHEIRQAFSMMNGERGDDMI